MTFEEIEQRSGNMASAQTWLKEIALQLARANELQCLALRIALAQDRCYANEAMAGRLLRELAEEVKAAESKIIPVEA